MNRIRARVGSKNAPFDGVNALHDDSPPNAALSLLEFASLSMGLELLAHRTSEVYADFGLNEVTGAREIEAWRSWLEKRPRDTEEYGRMRGRMRDRWVRWEQSNPQQSTLGLPMQVIAVPAAVVSPSPPVTVGAPPSRPTLSLVEYASMSMALEVYPHRAEEIDAIFRFGNESERMREEGLWAQHLKKNENDAWEWRILREKTRQYWARWNALTPQRGRVGSALKPKYPRPTTAAANKQPDPSHVRSSTEIRTRLTILDYAALAASLERNGHQAAEAFARYGLDEASGRVEVEAWKRRLAHRPAERARYDEIRSELAAAKRSGETSRTRIAPISLASYAALCVEFEHDVARAEAILVAAGLVDVAARAAADQYWRARLEANAEERRGFDELRSSYRRQRAADCPQESGGSESGAESLEGGVTLLQYAVLCVEIDLHPDGADRVYSTLGLHDESRRRAVHDAWQSRFERDPEARAVWFAHVKRMRAAAATPAT